MIELSCRCGTTIRVPDELRGKTGRCPKCAVALVVPASPVVPEPLAPPAAARAPATELRDTFKVRKVRCECGVTTAVRRGQDAATARCPACDRLLPLELE